MGGNQDCEQKRFSFEEYKLVVDATERIVDRKFDLNRTNCSICLAILAGLGIQTAWAYEGSRALHIVLPLVVTASAISVAFVYWWYMQLIALKNLNTAKFSVIEQMAPFVDFGNPDISPFQPFKVEWEVMDQKGFLSERSVKKRTRMDKTLL